VIGCFFVDRDSGESGINNNPGYSLQISLDIHCNYVGAGFHNLRGLKVIEANNPFQHFLLILYDTGCKIQGFGNIIYGNILALFSQPYFYNPGGSDQDVDQGAEDPVEYHKRCGNHKCKIWCKAVGINLWNNLSKEQQHKGNYYHLYHKSQNLVSLKVKDGAGDKGGDGNNSNINKIIGYKYVCQ